MTIERDEAWRSKSRVKLKDLHQRLKVASGLEAWGVERAELDAQDPECAELARTYGKYDDACGAVLNEINKRAFSRELWVTVEGLIEELGL